MAGYIDLNGIRTWYDDRGVGDPLVLLHGGLTDSRDFTGNPDALADGHRLPAPLQLAVVPGPRTCSCMRSPRCVSA